MDLSIHHVTVKLVADGDHHSLTDDSPGDEQC